MNGELYPGEFEAMERQGRLDAVIPEQKMMTNEEAIEILTREIDEDPFMRTEYRERIHEALKMGVKALEQINKIKAIIESPIYVQEDVFRYKAICELFKSEEQE